MGDFLGRFYMGLLRFLGTMFFKVTFIAIAPVVTFFRFIFNGIVTVESYFNEMMAQSITALDGQTAYELTFSTAIGIANFFVPLDTIFELTALILPLMTAAFVYRTVKSWIPTLS